MKILIVAGHSASGKTTVLEKMCETLNYEKLTTTTTREMRPGEVNGVDYHFLTKEEFLIKKEDGFFLEDVQIKGNFYGSGLNAFDKDFGNNIPCIILDPIGAKTATDILRKHGHTPISVFIDETPETCIKRVLSREASSAEKLKRVDDIKNAEAGWSNYMKYDFKTIPLSSCEENVEQINQFVTNFPEIKLTEKKEVDNKNNKKLKP